MIVILLRMLNNPQEAILFSLQHIEEYNHVQFSEDYKRVYQGLGYVRFDLEDIDLSEVAKQSQPFMQTLEENDREYYLKRKYEAMVLRRNKIIKEVNEEYQTQRKQDKNMNMSTMSERRESKHPVVGKLRGEQSVFYDKESRYYDKITSLKLKKFNEAQHVQENSYLNSSHYKTLREKTSLSLSSKKSVRSCSSSRSLNEERRIQVYNQAQTRKHYELQLRMTNFATKEQRAKQKVERVYRNLKILSMEKKQKAEVENELVRQNKEQVKKEILQDIYQKNARTTRQIQRFNDNRRQQLSQRDNKLQSQKQLFNLREKQVEDHIEYVIKKNREAMSQQIERQLQQAEKNKKRLDQMRRIELKQAAQFQRQRSIQADHTKRILSVQKAKRNQQMFMAYNQHLHQAVSTKEQKVKFVKTKLLDQRIKDQLAAKNQIILKRKQQFKNRNIIQKHHEKERTVEEISKLKEQLLSDRKVFFGKTLKKIRIMDRQLVDKLGSIEYRSLSKSRQIDGDMDKATPATSSRVAVS